MSTLVYRPFVPLAILVSLRIYGHSLPACSEVYLLRWESYLLQ